MSNVSLPPTATVSSPSSLLPWRSSVGMCLINAAGLVLCAERRDTPGAWQMPQGGVHRGEDEAVAVMRELREEVGTDNAEIVARVPERLRYDFPDFLQSKRDVFHGKYRGQEQSWFALRFLGEDSEISLLNAEEQEAPEFVAWRWIALEEMPDLIVDFKREVYRRVVAEFLPIVEKIRG